MRHLKSGAYSFATAIVNHPDINMSYILAMKFAMIPGAAVQDYSLRSQTMIQI
jgi:hypothetical protein